MSLLLKKNMDQSSTEEEYVCTQMLQLDAGSSLSQASINSIYRKFECSFCETTIGLDIFSCSGDTPHLFCEECAGQVSECPFCMTSISTSRSDEIKRCFKSLRSIPCKYKPDGCQAILSGDEITFHLPQCNFRPIKCFLSKCGQLVPFKQFLHHLTSAHASRMHGIYNSNHHEIEWWINGDISNPATWPPYFFTCFNNVFLYMANSTSFGTREWVWIIGSEAEALRFNVKATLRTYNNLSTTQWHGPVHSIRKSAKDISDSGMVFVTNCKDVMNPFMFKKPEHANRNFWVTDVEIIEIQPPSPETFLYTVTTGKTMEFHASVNMQNEIPKSKETEETETIEATLEQQSDADAEGNKKEEDLRSTFYLDAHEPAGVVESDITSDQSAPLASTEETLESHYSSARLKNENRTSAEEIVGQEPVSEQGSDENFEEIGSEGFEQLEAVYAMSQPTYDILRYSDIPNSNRTQMNILTIEYEEVFQEMPTPSMLRALLIPAEMIHPLSPINMWQGSVSHPPSVSSHLDGVVKHVCAFYQTNGFVQHGYRVDCGTYFCLTALKMK
ncbi:E3 ubiquitin-protein ligase SINAT5 [Orchesella cincta]|uniref:E3 ubiquitin-protein ligase SINAT5 n=1 Tax=Orchesella cincta TaxID=48709 RepID=A0A1D2M9S9_ORCCI|nr:E3 ubiquitin-protein ligase SINAT5 [Orchesella cincta]